MFSLVMFSDLSYYFSPQYFHSITNIIYIKYYDKKVKFSLN